MSRCQNFWSMYMMMMKMMTVVVGVVGRFFIETMMMIVVMEVVVFDFLKRKVSRESRKDIEHKNSHLSVCANIPVKMCEYVCSECVCVCDFTFIQQCGQYQCTCQKKACNFIHRQPK